MKSAEASHTPALVGDAEGTYVGGALGDGWTVEDRDAVRDDVVVAKLPGPARHEVHSGWAAVRVGQQG